MRRRLFIFILAALTVITGCERRPLEYGNATIDLRLNIRLNVQVNGQVQNLPEPEMMRVMFFDPETFDLVTECYLPAGGGRVSLPPGKYKFIGYNFDTQATLLRNDRNYYSIEAYTNEVSQALKTSTLNAIRRATSAVTRGETADELSAWDLALKQIQENPVIYEPDHLFVSHQDVEVLNIDGEQVIEANAETIIETWKISVRIRNEQYMASARALLTGQIASNFIGLPKEQGKTDTDVTLMFDMTAGNDSEYSDLIVGQFNTFGKNPSVESRLWLTIIIKTVGGDVVEWHRDITDEFFTDVAYEDQIIHIEEEIDLPQPQPGSNGSGGFQPGVDDWDEEDIPINI
ncbi:MAG: DUF5119 domain-containing protein [Bacteroidales bacterium]|nr:DUF5119 domain-containing protein [Bacteroidales bacterium]